MTRRRFRKQAVTPSLFPFLAVLVCTMGALIVLLVLVVQQARVYATSVAEQRAAQESELDEQLGKQLLLQDDYEWEREVLEEQRAALAEQLSEGRLELSHLEDHIRRLEQQWNQLKAAAEQFTALGSQQAATSEQTEAELEQLQAAIVAARQRLDEARQEAAARPQTFAIVPYAGANGTKRRPIYIECTESGISIQPEGIVLHRGDLEGPLGPGNPLDAALRATREHWARQGDTAIHGEPYPLLIVRPNGTLAYNYAREALKAWDDEFGYELIDAQMQLDYPNRDPVLRDVLTRTVQQARERQAILIAAMPSQFEQQAVSGGYVATPTRGGFRPLGGSGTGAGLGGSGTGGLTQAGDDGADSTGDQGNSRSFQVERPNFASHEQPATGAQNNDQASLASTGQGSATADTNTGPGGPLAKGGTDGSSGGASPLGKRGANWAIPKAAAGATAYQIPVRIVCKFDRLTFLPRPSDSTPPVDVMAADPLAGSIDQFVAEMWKQIEQWDAAPLGGYWQPVLEVYVYPGAEQRFLELRSLLAGSGIQVQRQAQ